MNGGFFYNVKYAAILSKPKLMKRLVYSTIKAKLFNQAFLRYVDINLSNKCNLHCTHCFATALDSDGPPLSPDQWHDIAGQCMELGSVSFGITGGEPLMNKNLPELVRALYPQENLITINSNGTLLTNEKAKTLHEAGVDIFQFSMDSYLPEEHDQFRKRKGVFHKLIKAIDIALDNHMKVTLVCTVSHQTVRSAGVQGVIDYAKKRGILLILSRAAPTGEWLGDRKILLTKEDQEYMYGLVRKYSNVRTDMDTNFKKYGCSAATEKLYVSPFGEVLPCPFMHITFGNLKLDSVKVVRDRMLSVPRLNNYALICHVAEDSEFIEGPLAKTFQSKRNVTDWKECF